MLNSEEIIKGLQELAGLFNHSVQEKDWKKTGKKQNISMTKQEISQYSSRSRKRTCWNCSEAGKTRTTLL